jgi:AcrR family transcriptional regulator
MTERRSGLSRVAILEGAVALADQVGLEAFTMRRLAEALDTKPMTIYHHVPSKDEILSGMVEVVFDEIALPPEDLPWTDALRVRCLSARQALNRHWWAAPLMESQASPGESTLRHHEAVLACLRRGGLSWELTAHAYAVLDSYVYGFAFEEATLPAQGGEGFSEVAEEMVPGFSPDRYPNLVAFTIEHVMQPGYSFGASFEFGLDLIISGLAEASRRERGVGPGDKTGEAGSE